MIRIIYKKVPFLLAFCISLLTAAQNPVTNKDTIKNQVDKNGLKQGYWITYYESGSTKYEGTFKNDKPIGTFTRYYPNRNVQSIMEFEEDGKTAFAKIFYNNGELAAEGSYNNRLKQGEWKYYSFYDRTLTHSENYEKGQKHGVSTVYYPNGKVSQTILFKNDEKDGVWAQYFETGRLYLKGMFREGKLNGGYIQYHPNGITHIQGIYADDKRDGEWVLYDEKGEQVVKFDYVMGIAENQDELDKIQEEFLKQLEKNIGKIKEPSISDIKF